MRPEYPRPDFVREEWMSLNGPWGFSYEGGDKTIQVPFVCQCAASGIGERIREDRVVYRRNFAVPKAWKGKQVLLNFGAVDYECSVYINDRFAGGHTGGQTPFSLDITGLLEWGEESIRVECEDPVHEEGIPRGKQFWEEKNSFIWYIPSTGIWQSVWLEPVEKTSFVKIHFTPDVDQGTVRIDYRLRKGSVLPCRLGLMITFQGKSVFEGRINCTEQKGSLTVDVFQKKAMAGAFHFTGNYWSPEEPNLYDAVLTLERDGTLTDRVSCYFGMRKIQVIDGQIWLNNRLLYQRLLLDQGYWKESLISAPYDDAYKIDIEMAKKMGFNGCRKHEKAEDPRFLYWADKLGFLVWGAMASFWAYTEEGAAAFMREWQDVIMRDYNHPSIIVWDMLNESWGVPGIYEDKKHQNFARSLYYIASALDSTRLVISNDGWEMTESDICAFHSYKHGGTGDERSREIFTSSLKDVYSLHKIMSRPLYATGFGYGGQPGILSECGGITLSGGEGWGYTRVEKDGFLEEYAGVLKAIGDSELLCGFCYTQLADVQQETNGLLTEEHEYKFDPDKIREITEQAGRRNSG